MPRVVFFGYPARGHTSPTLSIVAEFVRRGVEVDYHSAPAFQTAVETAGARFFAYPRGYEALLATPANSEEHLAQVLGATLNLLPPMIEALDPRPDLVLFDASALWGGLAARRLGLPCVASITTFAMNRPMLSMIGAPRPAPWGEPILERLNAEHGANLRDHLDLMVPAADLKFVYAARSFQPAGRFVDSSYLFLGPQFGQRAGDGAGVDPAGSRPLAYVSLGTIFQDHALLLLISQVLATHGWQVVVSLGDAAATQRRAWPEHVEAHAFVDQIAVLKQAKLFVTHGGMNSVSEALAHAVPMIVIPQAVDQHLVARQTANLGAAVAIEPGAVSTETLGQALARIEDERAAFEAACTSLQQSFTQVQGVADAVDQALALIQQDQVPLG